MSKTGCVLIGHRLDPVPGTAYRGKPHQTLTAIGDHPYCDVAHVESREPAARALGGSRPGVARPRSLPEIEHHAHQLRDRGSAHLLHDACAVNLDRALAEEIGRASCRERV